MKLFKTFNKKNIVLLLTVLAFFALLFLNFLSDRNTEKNADTPRKRAEFLKSAGITVDVSSESPKEINIPNEFSDVYEKYNLIQKKAGYDLSDYKGADAVLYSYTVSSGGTIKYYVNLIVYRGRVIGGDVSSCEINGKMIPLKKEEIKKCLK